MTSGGQKMEECSLQFKRSTRGHVGVRGLGIPAQYDRSLSRRQPSNPLFCSLESTFRILIHHLNTKDGPTGVDKNEQDKKFG
jgi:hypothetical protein